jgi:hypothetical protein
MEEKTYKVTLIIGNEYEIIVKAADYQDAYNIAFDWDETEETSSIISTEEIDVGRTVKTVEIFNDICSCCQQTKYDCEADSERAFQVKDLLTLIAQGSTEENSEYIHEALEAYLTYGVSPCNTESKS